MTTPEAEDSADEATPLLLSQARRPLNHRASFDSCHGANALSPGSTTSCATSAQLVNPHKQDETASLGDRHRSLQAQTAAALTGVVTALVAYVVDIGAALVADLKEGRCARNVLLDRRRCCGETWAVTDEQCAAWMPWTETWGGRYGIYVGFAIVFAGVASGITATTVLKAAVAPGAGEGEEAGRGAEDGEVVYVSGAEPEGYGDGVEATSHAGDEEAGISPSKLISRSTCLCPVDLGAPNHKQPAPITYLSSGSGIPQLKSILAGFPVPQGFLSLRVLLAKAAGCVFAVGAGMSLGKEGPFVHISACVGDLVARLFPRLQSDERRRRAVLSVACAAGIAVTFGAPVGGVLFSYEELSTHFPRRVLALAFLCSLFASIALRELDPKGTGRLMLLETHFSDSIAHSPLHYMVFLALGVCGGLAGGLFCRLIEIWTRIVPRLRRRVGQCLGKLASRGVRHAPALLEVVLTASATAAVQYPNRLVRPTGDMVLTSLLVDCRDPSNTNSWLCRQESRSSSSSSLYGLCLLAGSILKIFLTVGTLTSPVPNGVIIPMLDAGALFGRTFGHSILPAVLPRVLHEIPPGVCAMVGAAAFLAGVSRMTICLVVLMVEMTGEVGLVPGFMVATGVAGWTAGRICKEGVYEICGRALGCPVLATGPRSGSEEDRESGIVGDDS